MARKNLLIILGATASGKTNLAVNLAGQLDGEIISADSRQVFKGMNIGTGKDLDSYHIQDQKIPYHLIDIKAAGEKYHVNAFKEDFYQSFQTITSTQKLPILCGGTGMYIHSLLQNHEFTAVPVNMELRGSLQHLTRDQLQQRLATCPTQITAHVDLHSTKRLIRAIEIADYLKNNNFEKQITPALSPIIIGLYNDVETRRIKIIERLNQRLENGLIEEVELLIANGVTEEMLVFYGLEYKFVVAYLNGTLDLESLTERLGIAICQYAKRQMTFFRKMEKDGVRINWIEAIADRNTINSTAIRLVKEEFDLK